MHSLHNDKMSFNIVRHLRLPQSLQEILLNVGWLSVNKVIQLVANLIIGVWVVRYLGPEQFGVISYAISFVAIFKIIALLGLEGTVVHQLVQEPDNANEILGTVFLLRLLGGSLSIVFLVVGLHFISIDRHTAWIVVIIGLENLLDAFLCIDLWFQARTRSKYTSLASMFVVLTGAILKSLLILFQAPLLFFAIEVLVEKILLSIGLVYFYSVQKKSILHWKFRWQWAKSLMVISWPLVFSGIGAALNLRIDQVMIGSMRTTNDVGIYAAAAKLSETWYFIPGFVAVSVFPMLLRSKEQGREMYETRLQQLYDLMALLSLAIAVVVTLSSPWLIQLLYGDAYRDTAVVLSIHIWAGVFVFWERILSRWLIAESIIKFSLVRHLVGASANIILNLLLIPRFGVYGAAVSTVISYAASSYFICWFFPRTRNASIMMTKSLFAFLRTKALWLSLRPKAS